MKKIFWGLILTFIDINLSGINILPEFVGYLLIWAVIYSVIKRNTEQLNAILQQKQQTAKDQ